MTVEIRQLDNGLGLAITWSGTLTEAEYLDFYREQLSKESVQHQEHRYSITDWSDVTETQLSPDAIAQVAWLFRDVADVSSHPVIAIVAREDMSFGLCRMWEMQTADSEPIMMVFREREAAKIWVRQQVKARYGIDNLTFN